MSLQSVNPAAINLAAIGVGSYLLYKVLVENLGTPTAEDYNDGAYQSNTFYSTADFQKKFDLLFMSPYDGIKPKILRIIHNHIDKVHMLAFGNQMEWYKIDDYTINQLQKYQDRYGFKVQFVSQ